MESMNYEAVKMKLHEFIEHADHEKVMALYTLIGSGLQDGDLYDAQTIALLESRRDDMISGKVQTYTLEQTIANLTKRRKRDEV